MILSRMVFVAGLLCAIPVAADADVIVIIPGTADPWLAGMPDGSTASDGDTAPAQSPVEVLGLFFGPGGLRFFSTGATDHCGGGACGLAGAEGDFTEAIPGHLTGVAGAENGIGNIFAPIDSLIGLFLGPGAPNLSAAPESVLDFRYCGVTRLRDAQSAS